MTKTLICDCNQTMPLSAKALGEALHEDLTLHSTLCRRDAGAFQKALQSGQEVVVACTQEQRLFADLGQQTEGAVSPIRFVNIRETGGWSRDAAQASPKIAALLAAAHLPEPQPVPWLTDEDIAFYGNEFSASGFRGPLNRYRNHDRDFAWQQQFIGRQITQPALFIGGERDLALRMLPGVKPEELRQMMTGPAPKDGGRGGQ